MSHANQKLITTLPPYIVTHTFALFEHLGSSRRASTNHVWNPIILLSHIENASGEASGQIVKAYASEISITLLKWVRVQAVIICNLRLGWWMTWWVCSALHASISGALEVCSHPHSLNPLHLLTMSLLQIQECFCLSVCEGIHMCLFVLSFRFWNIFSSQTVVELRF